MFFNNLLTMFQREEFAECMNSKKIASQEFKDKYNTPEYMTKVKDQYKVIYDEVLRCCSNKTVSDEDLAKINDMAKAYSLENEDGEFKGADFSLREGKELEEYTLRHERAMKLMADYIARTASYQPFYSNTVVMSDGHVYSRQIQHFLKGSIDGMSMEDMKKYNDKIAKMTSAEKKALFLENLGKFEKFSLALDKAQSDEEFINLVDGNMSLFNGMGEVQYSENMVEKVQKELGFTLDEAEKARWKRMSASAVDNTTLINRLGVMANPYYMYKDVDGIAKMADYVSKNAESLNGYTTAQRDKIIEDNTTKDQVLAQMQKGEPIANTFKELGSAVSMLTPEYNAIKLQAKFVNTINDLGISEENLKGVKFIDQNGKKVNLEDAGQKLYDGQKLTIIRNGKFLQQMTGEKKYGCVTVGAQKSVNLEKASEKEIKDYLNDFKNKVDNSNKWYVKLFNVFSSNSLSSISSKINSILASDLSDRNALKVQMRELGRKCENYVGATTSYKRACVVFEAETDLKKADDISLYADQQEINQMEKEIFTRKDNEENYTKENLNYGKDVPEDLKGTIEIIHEDPVAENMIIDLGDDDSEIENNIADEEEKIGIIETETINSHK